MESLEHYVERLNIGRYRDLLETKIDASKRIILSNLLSEELTKQASHTKQS